MNDLRFWQHKLVQTLHDPVQKALIMGSGRSHIQAAAKFAEVVIGRKLKAWNRAPDRLTAGGDRPMLGNGKLCHVDWRMRPVITHPLQPGVRLEAPSGQVASGRGSRAWVDALNQSLVDFWEEHGPEALAEREGEGEEQELPEPWNQVETVRRTQLALWRMQPRLVETLGLDVPWLPADSRCPDHTVLDHLRVAAAAPYLERLDRAESSRRAAREPWLVIVSVRGVQKYIAESRKTRDLWTSCMIFGELAWASMRPVVETYGPEAVLYPDLRENPLMDQWLIDEGLADTLPDPVRQEGAATFAAPLPNTWVGLLPQGGEGYLEPIEKLLEHCRARVKERWQEMAGAVREYLTRNGRAGNGPWQRIWDRQLGPDSAPPVVWTAIPWKRRMVGLKGAPPDQRALVGILDGSAGFDDLPDILKKREQALRPWIPARAWRQYEGLRTVSWRTDHENQKRNPRIKKPYLSSERGFDYPMVHHQLKRMHGARKLHDPPRYTHEPGEKCALTGRDEALSDLPAGDAHSLGRHRRAANEFWRRFSADGGDEERLGGPAAMKRFLARADDETFVQRWYGRKMGSPSQEEHTAPFPSTAGLAMSGFLVTLGEQWNRRPALQRAGRRVLDAFTGTGLSNNTQHPLALPRLVPLGRQDPDLKRLYGVEPELLHPEALQIHIKGARTNGERARAEALERLQEVVQDFHSECRNARIPPPGTGVAVLCMDGDSMSKLLLGDPGTIRATWKDVLHPHAVEQIRDWDKDLKNTEWEGLLETPRAMGPSLHACITRSLAAFCHRMVGWVVEREFGGRLVYTGGDDVLAMLPSRDAIPAAARLQQLFSAPFVIDTRPDQGAWTWRRGRDGELGPRGKWERQRFRVPKVIRGGAITGDPHRWEFEAHAGTGEPTDPLSPETSDRSLFPMLGRASSMSAGIAMGHYKTPLQLLLQSARTALDEVAKGREDASGRKIKAAVAVDRFTRGGSKYTFCGPWRDPDSSQTSSVNPDPPVLPAHFRALVQGFQNAAIPHRLPYVVRQKLEAMEGVPFPPDRRREEEGEDITISETRRSRLLRGLVQQALDRRTAGSATAGDDLERALEAVLAAGVEQARKSPPADRPQTAVAGLLLARDLAAEDLPAPASDEEGHDAS